MVRKHPWNVSQISENCTFSEMRTILRKIPDIQGEKSNGTENLGITQKVVLFIGILQKAPFDTGKSNRKHVWASKLQTNPNAN